MEKTLIILVLFLFPILISCNSYSGSSDKTVCVDTDALIRNGIIYLPNETKPFTGNNLCKYENGQIKSEGNYKDGKPDGKVIDWYENGQIEAEGNYKDGKPDGKVTGWFENGQIQTVLNLKDGKLDGKVIDWYENGQIEAEGNYKDGKLDGKATYWHENGKIKGKVTFKNGKCISGDCL